MKNAYTYDSDWAATLLSYLYIPSVSIAACGLIFAVILASANGFPVIEPHLRFIVIICSGVLLLISEMYRRDLNIFGVM